MRYIYLLLILVLISSSLAYDSDITELAELIDRNVNNTIDKVYLIDIFVDKMIEPEFNYYPKGISRTWEDKTGDCTDRAMLKQYMLDRINILARLVHGYNSKGKHDWYEFYYNDKWVTFEYEGKKVGNGIW